MKANKWIVIMISVALGAYFFWPAKKSMEQISIDEKTTVSAEVSSSASVWAPTTPAPVPSPVASQRAFLSATKSVQEARERADGLEAVSIRSGWAEGITAFPRSVLSALGGLAQQAWDHFTNMNFDEVKKSSAVLSFGGEKRGETGASLLKANRSSGEGTSAVASEETKKPRFVHWGEKNGCEADTNKTAGVGTEGRRPPKFAGFFARTYDEYHNLLKQTFVPADLNDPFGCGYYEMPIADLLPPNISEEQFHGFLALTSALGEQRTESQEVWLNLGKPKGLCSDLSKKGE